MVKSNGIILWEGKGFDGRPVVAIATGWARKSKNSKTGKMIQVWILPQDYDPLEAVYGNGDDKSICGNCPYRRGNGCYVKVFQAPLTIWRAWKNGSYPVWDGNLDIFRGKMIRWGAYGDPALIPLKLIQRVNAVSDGWTGYTHAWKRRSSYHVVFMASIQTDQELEQARARKWKTFQLLAKGQKSIDKELLRLSKQFLCPASEEAGHRLSCDQCGACCGGEWTGQATPVIPAHGQSKNRIPLMLV